MEDSQNINVPPYKQRTVAKPSQAASFITMPDISYTNDGCFTYHTQTFFDELDAQWILHHSRQIAAVERAQQAFFDHVMDADQFDPHRFPDINVVVRRLEVDYLVPLKGVGPYKITLRVARLREAAMTTAFELRSTNGDILYTRGLRTVCKLSMKSGAPCGWTPEFRERFSIWEKAAQQCQAQQ